MSRSDLPRVAAFLRVVHSVGVLDGCRAHGGSPRSLGISFSARATHLRPRPALQRPRHIGRFLAALRRSLPGYGHCRLRDLVNEAQYASRLRIAAQTSPCLRFKGLVAEAPARLGSAGRLAGPQRGRNLTSSRCQVLPGAPILPQSSTTRTWTPTWSRPPGQRGEWALPCSCCCGDSLPCHACACD
jgi:hypothetical protein